MERYNSFLTISVMNSLRLEDKAIVSSEQTKLIFLRVNRKTPFIVPLTVLHTLLKSSC